MKSVSYKQSITFLLQMSAMIEIKSFFTTFNTHGSIDSYGIPNIPHSDEIYIALDTSDKKIKQDMIDRLLLLESSSWDEALKFHFLEYMIEAHGLANIDFVLNVRSLVNILEQ